MIKGEFTINYFFGRIFFAFVIGEDKRESNRSVIRQRRNRVSNFLFVILIMTLLLSVSMTFYQVYAYLFPNLPRIDTF